MQIDSNRKLKIAQVIWGLEIGGAERVVQKLAHGLEDKGHDVTVVTFKPDGLIYKELEEKAIKIKLIKKRHRFDFTIIWQLISFFRSEKFDIVNTHLITADIWGRIAAIFAGVPGIIVTAHSESPPFRNNFQIQIDKFLSFFTDKIIAVSKRVVNYHIKRQNINRDLFHIIYNGIELSSFKAIKSKMKMREELNLSENDIVMGTVGRLSKEKNQEKILNIVARLKKDGFPLTTMIVGDGSERKNLEKKVDELDIGELIHFLGERKDIPDLLQAMDIWLNTSLMEGFSIAVLEAMLSKLPVIATNAGGNEEAIVPGVTGYVVDDEIKFSNYIKHIVNDPALLKSMGEDGHKRVTNFFTQDIMITQTEKLYLSLI